MPGLVTRSLPAHVVLLAAAAALAASLIFAMVVAEVRDVDGRPGKGLRAVPVPRVESAQAAERRTGDTARPASAAVSAQRR